MRSGRDPAYQQYRDGILLRYTIIFHSFIHSLMLYWVATHSYDVAIRRKLT
jgi:hypothetical protein